MCANAGKRFRVNKQIGGFMQITTVRDLRRYVSDMTAGVIMSCYTCEYDELVDAVSESLRKLLRSKGFKMGDELPEISDEEFWDLFLPFLKEKNI